MIGDSIEDVQRKMDSRKARVFTASEFKRRIREEPGFDGTEADVITCGTFGIMSGTMAVLTIPVAGVGDFKRADTITLNGVPGFVGPCPNESLGLVDCVVYGTSRRDRGYGGGHLFRDMVAGEGIDIVATSEGKVFKVTRTLSEMPFARMILTRGAFKNYTCFANGSDAAWETIFSGPRPLGPDMSEASVSGCGEINPLQNDPEQRYLRPGATALLNGAPAMVLGNGTRSSPQKPNLSIEADMHRMRADLMGGFRTSEGPECLVSVATAIPVTTEEGLSEVSVSDEGVLLPLADVRDRIPMHKGAYSWIWRGTDLTVSSDRSRCLHCDGCEADAACPVDARPSSGADPDRCMSCGLCVSACPGGVFSAGMGSVMFGDREVPVVVRQSSRDKAERLCRELKEAVENGEWNLRDVNGKI